MHSERPCLGNKTPLSEIGADEPCSVLRCDQRRYYHLSINFLRLCVGEATMSTPRASGAAKFICDLTEGATEEAVFQSDRQCDPLTKHSCVPWLHSSNCRPKSKLTLCQIYASHVHMYR